VKGIYKWANVDMGMVEEQVGEERVYTCSIIIDGSFSVLMVENKHKHYAPINLQRKLETEDTKICQELND
jgi:phenylalanine-4-hydroxylase